MKPATNVALAALLLVALPSAQGRRLNGPLAQAVVAGGVRQALVSPDGTRVVFLAEGAASTFDLFSAPIGGGAAARLTTLAPGRVVADSVLVTPDSARVVYSADQDVEDWFELYSVPIAGGPTTKLSGELAPGVQVAGLSPRVSASTGRVVYRTLGVGGPDLFSVPSDGSAAPLQLNAGGSLEGVQADFAISFDGLGVAYRSDATVNHRIDLWVVRIDGTIPPQLRAAGPGQSDVLDFAFAPGDAHLVYRADHENADLPDLYSVPVVGGAPTKLDPTLTSGGRVLDYAISPDGASVVYRAFQVADQGIGLYSVAIDGGWLAELEASGVSEFVVGGASPYRVVYRDDQDGNGDRELHTVPLEGGASTQLALPDADVQDGFELSPDGARVVFEALDTRRCLYSAPLEGGTVVRLNPVSPAPLHTIVTSFEIAPDSASVLYVADQIQPNWNQSEVWIVPIEGGAATRLNGETVSGGNAGFAQFDPTGARVVYLATQDTRDAVELYSVASSGGPTTKLNPPLTTSGMRGDVLDFRLQPDGSRAVYLADEDVDDVQELFAVRTSGGAPVRLNATFGPDHDVTAFEVSPDWSRVVYCEDQYHHAPYRFFSRPIDGGAPIELDTGPIAMGNVDGLVISADSARVVYRADRDVDEQFELYSVPIAGGAVVQLNPALVAEGDVSAGLFRVSPDSSRVVYVADDVANNVFELWSVPIAGGPAVRLNGALVIGGDVTSFEIAADSSRVVYLADQGLNDRFDLWSVPLAGGSAVRLDPTLVFAGDVSSYRLAADSSRVVYRADQDQDEVWELFSVPLAGGTAVQLNAALVAGGDVLEGAGDVVISADSSRVLYRADQDTDGVAELYQVPLGGGTVVRLNAPLSPGEGVHSFQLAPSSTRAVFRAGPTVGAPLLGVELATGTITPLHAALQPGADSPSAYLVTPDSTSVVGVSALLDPMSYRLWAFPLSGAGPRALSAELPDGAASFDARAGRVVYRTPLESSAGVTELFAATLPRPLRDGSAGN